MRFVVCVLLVLAACSSDEDGAAPAGTTASSTSMTEQRDVRWDLTAEDWERRSLSSGEVAYREETSLAFGIGTNAAKMLEYGYDLCERFSTTDSRADAIRDWATEEGRPLQAASTLGAAASDYLCP